MLDLSDPDQLFADPCKHFPEGDLFNPGVGENRAPYSDPPGSGVVVQEGDENEPHPDTPVDAEVDADDTE